MFGKVIRPWGPADWLFPKLKTSDWVVLGSIATEDRCLSILHHITTDLGLKEARFLKIKDLPSQWADRCNQKLNANLNSFKARVRGKGQVLDFELLGSPRLLKMAMAEVHESGARNVILDTTCLPKRFFFPMIRLLLENNQIENLVASYSTPDSYLSQTESLAFEPQDWSYLPMFQRTEAPPPSLIQRVIVGVGFMPFHLPDLLKQDYQDARLILILPFPPGPPQFQRNWQFVHDIDRSCVIRENRHIARIDACDTSGCFKYLEMETGAETKTEARQTVFAPFGPKPHSLAMCLFAIKHSCDVIYTQPKYYHPDYSTGMRMVNGRPETYAYALKLDGRDLYKTSPVVPGDEER